MKKTTKLKSRRRVEIALSKSGDSFYLNIWIGPIVRSVRIESWQVKEASEEWGILITDYTHMLADQQKLEL